MEETNEKLLIHKAKSGDKNAFGLLIIEYEKSVYNIALRMMRNEEDAKDVAQEALIKVYKNLNKFDEKSTFKTWIYRVTMNTALDAIRKQKSTKQKETFSLDEQIEVKDDKAIDKEHQPESQMILNERKKVLYDAMNQLSQDQKSIVLLRDIKGLSYKEIAYILDSSEGTVKSRLNRGRKKLKEILMNTELFRKNDV